VVFGLSLMMGLDPRPGKSRAVCFPNATRRVSIRHMWKWLIRRRPGGPVRRGESAPKRPEAGRAAAETVAPPDLRALGEYSPAAHDPVDPHDETDLRREVLWASRSHADLVPAFPAMASRILERARDPAVDHAALVRLIQQEPPIAAQVLRFANSPLYGSAGAVESIRDAVTRLGLREVTQIVATAALLALTDAESQAAGERFRRPWMALRRHAVVSAFAASWLAMETGKAASERAFLAGLLHDVGKTVVLRALSVLDPARQEDAGDRRLAVLMEGVHTRTGPGAIRRWGLPGWLATVAACHHDETLPPDADAPLVHVVRAASGVDELRRNPFHRAGLPDEVAASFAALGLGAARQRAFVAQVAELSAKADALLGG
jgi:HD-like signal output (HDOD) protein